MKYEKPVVVKLASLSLVQGSSGGRYPDSYVRGNYG